MNNVTFFLKGCQAGAYKKKEWAFSVFCVSELPEEYDPKTHYPFKVYQKDGSPCIYTKDLRPDEEGDYEFITLNGKLIQDEPILYPDEQITIKEGDVPNYKGGPLKTTPGKVFMNWYVLAHTLGHRWPYVNEDRVRPDSLSEKIATVVQDEPDNPAQRRPDIIYVSDYKRFLTAGSQFSGFTGINTPSATEYTMTGAPGIRELRDKLLEENKDKLNDPITVVDIEKQLIAYDEAYLKKDPYEGFYIGRKSIDTARKKLHGIQGLQGRMDSSKKDVLIRRSLSEPIDPAAFPAEVDSMRIGSHSRGQMTALGGEAVKFIYRIYTAAEIIKEDCGAKMGIRRLIDESNYNYYVNCYLLEGGQSILLTEDNIKKYIGKTVMMRSPGYCLADPGGRGYCQKCIGEAMRGRPKSLAAYGSDVTSTMNTRFMKAVHVDSKSTVELQLDRAIT